MWPSQNIRTLPKELYLVVTGAARKVTPRGATVGVASVETDTFMAGTSTSFSSLIGLRLNRVMTVVEFSIATFKMNHQTFMYLCSIIEVQFCANFMGVNFDKTFLGPNKQQMR